MSLPPLPPQALAHLPLPLGCSEGGEEVGEEGVDSADFGAFL